MNTNQLTFVSSYEPANIETTLVVGGSEKNISIALRDVSNNVSVNVIEELLNDVFSNSEFLVKVLERYPDTYARVREHFTLNSLLFQEYHGTFTKYVQRAIMQMFTVNTALAEQNLSSVEEFLTSLDVDVLRIMATIKTIGNHTGSTFVEFDDSFSTYLHYEKELDSDTNCSSSKEDYIRLISSDSWEYGQGYVFLQGIERLGIMLEGVPNSSDVIDAVDDDNIVLEFNVVA